MTAYPYRVRELSEQDARAASALHVQAFPTFFLSRLGGRFLTRLYSAFAADEKIVALCIERGGELVAVAAGPVQSQGYLTRLVRARFFGFASAALPAALKDPRIVTATARRIREGGSEARHGALLASICVAPAAQRQGVGRVLIDAWCAAAVDAGAKCVFLTTDTEANSRTHAFYLTNGWVALGEHLTHEGRRMTTYGRDLRRMGDEA